MDIGQFFLTNDDGREYLQSTDQEGWESNIQCAMTIVVCKCYHDTDGLWDDTMKYQCPFCECWNSLKENKGKS